MTRGGQESSITNNNPSQGVPDAILTLTKNVLGQNMTKTIEPMIKRIGVVETRDDPDLETSTSNVSNDHAIAVTSSSALAAIDAKQKKKKQKNKRKDQTVKQPQLEQLVEQQHSEARKISIY